MQTKSFSFKASTRVDFLGGTLDLFPINQILENCNTVNAAIGVKASIEVSSYKNDYYKIISTNYNTDRKFHKSELEEIFKDGFFNENHFGPLSFVVLLLKHFDNNGGVCIRLSSEAPAGSGLGGSSTLGICLFKALCSFYNLKISNEKAIEVVRSYEAMILNQGIPGYQDYYPAAFGGMLNLEVKKNELFVEQLYSEDLKKYLEDNVRLIFSGLTRKSGINNWNLYKNFFDGDQEIKKGLLEISKLSQAGLGCLKEKNFKKFLEIVAQEGEVRNRFFEGFVNKEMKDFSDSLEDGFKIKVCGAGGGGCFIIIRNDETKKFSYTLPNNFKELKFSLEAPLEET